MFGVDDETMEVGGGSTCWPTRGLTLGLAESLTGGLDGARFSLAARSHGVFGGGLVLDGAAESRLLTETTHLDLLSPEGARAAAAAARRTLGTDVGLAVTGVGDPLDEQAAEGHPIGTVFVGIAHGDATDAVSLRLPGDRERIRNFATISAFDRLRRDLLAARAAR